MKAKERCIVINERLQGTGLFGGAKREVHSQQNATWRISPEPIWITHEDYEFFEALGPQLLAFYKAANKLYFESAHDREPKWVKEYLDMGKPELILDYGRMNRFKNDVPFIIRPDVFFTEEGPVATELDSVPGGMGLLAALSKYYGELGYELVGGSDGMVRGFLQGIEALTPRGEEPRLAVAVSDESSDYRDEMIWLGGALREMGLRIQVMEPGELLFQEDGLFYEEDGKKVPINILYRFFELFDLKNIPKIDLILYAVRKEMAVITPPLKSYLEEKLFFALFHHPALKGFWLQELGEETYDALYGFFPRTWILDPRPMPPQGIIPGLEVGGRPISNFNQLEDISKRERELVIKPSGFSELAWGSRGVAIGHDLSAERWKKALNRGLQDFSVLPHILQKFHKSEKISVSYYDFNTESIKREKGRTRYCPYYFVTDDEVTLGGILATVCPLNKKLIHGMVDSVMAPVAVRQSK